MLSAALLVGAAALTAATPLQLRQASQDPPQNKSTGFNLRVHIPSGETVIPSLQGWYLKTLHVGAGINVAILDSNGTDAPVFYENGTLTGSEYGTTTIVTDAGSQPFPESLMVPNATQAKSSSDPATANAYDAFASISVGQGTPASISVFPNPVALLANQLGTGTFMGCNRTVQYYDASFIVLEYAYNTETAAVIPAGCAPFKLLPQCATLPDLPSSGSISSHANVQTVGCYEDTNTVTGID
jgi:hypothetical protein